MKATATAFVAEPPAAYLVRPPLVVDCGAICAVLFDEPGRDEATRRMAGHTLHAPQLLDTEFANVALQKSRRGFPEDALQQALSDWHSGPVALHRIDAAAACRLGLQLGLTAYDAAYVWLAAELKAPLLTFDRRLAEAARIHLASL